MFTSAMGSKGERGRCVTGIEGLDTILGGGLPQASAVLVSGPPGTGKTSLSFEFLVRGALLGERGLLVTTIEPPQKLILNLPKFEFYDEKLAQKGTLQFLELNHLLEKAGVYGNEIERKDFMELASTLGEFVEENKIKRIVIDSLSAIFYGIEDRTVMRDFLLSLSDSLYENDCTAMLVSDVHSDGDIESVVADGIIVMGNYERHSYLLRTMQVMKMKGTGHSRAKYVIDLTTLGILVTPLLRSGRQ